LAQTVTNHSLYVNFRKIPIAEQSLTKEIPNISSRSVVCCSVSATRFLAVYKFKINVYGNWEKYCLKLLPTTVYRSIFVKSRSQNRLSVKNFQTFSFLRNFYFMWAKYCEKVRATTFSGKSRSRNRLHICTCAYLHVCIFARLHIFIQMKKF